MSSPKQLDFNLQFVRESADAWQKAAHKYHQEAEKAYTRMRSYLTMYQFRLSDQEKCEIREMLSQHLDNIEQNDLIQDMDNYLDGFCFKLDKTVLPNFKPIPKSVKIEIANTQTKPEEIAESQIQPKCQPMQKQLQSPIIPDHLMDNLPPIEYETLETFTPVNQTTVDYTDFDFYTMQFFQ